MITSLFGECDFNDKNEFNNVVSKNEKENCIVKVGNKWKIRGNKVKYWDAEFDTKKDAQAALRAYWAGKNK